MSFEPQVPSPEFVINKVMADSETFRGAETILTALAEAGYQLFRSDEVGTAVKAFPGGNPRHFYMVPKGRHEA